MVCVATFGAGRRSPYATTPHNPYSMIAPPAVTSAVGNLPVRKEHDTVQTVVQCVFRRSTGGGGDATCRQGTRRDRGTDPGPDGARRAAAPLARRVFVIIHVLHPGAAPGRRRCLQPHRVR